jgi:hypothetical protein
MVHVPRTTIVCLRFTVNAEAYVKYVLSDDPKILQAHTDKRHRFVFMFHVVFVKLQNLLYDYRKRTLPEITMDYLIV